MLSSNHNDFLWESLVWEEEGKLGNAYPGTVYEGDYQHSSFPGNWETGVDWDPRDPENEWTYKRSPEEILRLKHISSLRETPKDLFSHLSSSDRDGLTVNSFLLDEGFSPAVSVDCTWSYEKYDEYTS